MASRLAVSISTTAASEAEPMNARIGKIAARISPHYEFSRINSRSSHLTDTPQIAAVNNNGR
jgi:hypothetical protein